MIKVRTNEGNDMDTAKINKVLAAWQEASEWPGPSMDTRDMFRAAAEALEVDAEAFLEEAAETEMMDEFYELNCWGLDEDVAAALMVNLIEIAMNNVAAEQAYAERTS